VRVELDVDVEGEGGVQDPEQRDEARLAHVAHCVCVPPARSDVGGRGPGANRRRTDNYYEGGMLV